MDLTQPPTNGDARRNRVAHLAGEPHSDKRSCVSRVLLAFCATLNDSLEVAPR